MHVSAQYVCITTIVPISPATAFKFISSSIMEPEDQSTYTNQGAGFSEGSLSHGSFAVHLIRGGETRAVKLHSIRYMYACWLYCKHLD